MPDLVYDLSANAGILYAAYTLRNLEEGMMENRNLKCGLCGASFSSEQERREHEGRAHSAEIREKAPQKPHGDEEETAA